MRFACLVAKFAKENLRSRIMLLLVLFLAPVIIAIVYAASGNEGSQYRIGILDQGAAIDGDRAAYGSGALVGAIRAYADEAKATVLIEREADLASARKALADGERDLLLVVTAGFANSMEDAARGGMAKPKLTCVYDAGSLKSASLFGLVYSIATQHILSVTRRDLPYEIVEEFVEPANVADPLSPDAFIPTFLILSILNVLFLAASTIVREVEHGTMKRIVLSRATSFELIASISLVQAVISLICLLLSLGTAYLFGYRLHGSLAGALLVGFLSGLSIMAFSTITACFCRSVKDVWIVGNFPYMLCLFFSGFIPLPTVELFRLGSRSITANSFIPLSHGIKALERLLNGGGAVGDVLFEILAILVLTAFYFSIGLFFFYRRHMRLR